LIGPLTGYWVWPVSGTATVYRIMFNVALVKSKICTLGFMTQECYSMAFRHLHNYETLDFSQNWFLCIGKCSTGIWASNIIKGMWSVKIGLYNHCQLLAILILDSLLLWLLGHVRGLAFLLWSCRSSHSRLAMCSCFESSEVSRVEVLKRLGCICHVVITSETLVVITCDRMLYMSWPVHILAMPFIEVVFEAFTRNEYLVSISHSSLVSMST